MKILRWLSDLIGTSETVTSRVTDDEEKNMSIEVSANPVANEFHDGFMQRLRDIKMAQTGRHSAV
ncbi:hypothetical protein [Calycomorphotria hydatis]|uniref:Uncharacterized protein n=1 Tax=Calycomorphotria hydatis TaxID=2528027 RepID=A0A517TEM4_9PLAN|nr:hypothetical protein [Calycomorphotria hydatis]QDT66815.1 hypothetical protein V22_40870 [Calycomorphotria hydatis]